MNRIISDVIKCTQGKFDPKLLDIVLCKVSIDLADKSCCQFRENGELTLLGFINGILPELTGKVLIKNLDDDGNVIGWEITDKWW